MYRKKIYKNTKNRFYKKKANIWTSLKKVWSRIKSDERTMTGLISGDNSTITDPSTASNLNANTWFEFLASSTLAEGSAEN